jgi:hypothetical protein
MAQITKLNRINSFSRLRFAFLGKIEALNNHYKTPHIKYNPLIPISTFLVVGIGINNDFFSLSWNSARFFLSSDKNELKNKRNKL